MQEHVTPTPIAKPAYLMAQMVAVNIRESLLETKQETSKGMDHKNTNTHTHKRRMIFGVEKMCRG